MNIHTNAGYDPRTFKALTFHDAAARFRDGSDTPRAYLERCLETIAAREPVVKAFAATNVAAARAAADLSSARWTSNRPLSPIDGLPIGIKDLLETKDMPTEMGCEAYRGNFPKRDNAGGVGVAAGRRCHSRQDDDGRTRRLASAGDHQPVRFRAHRRRLVVGLGGSGCGAHAAGGDRHAGRRLDHPPRRLLRQLRAEADARRHQSRRAAGDQHEHAWCARRLHRGHVAGGDRDRLARGW